MSGKRVLGPEMTMDELKERELELLDTFDAFAKAHDLRYWLSFGTLIGAMRHGGFIPWDDDIDLVMPASDYFRMVELVDGGAEVGENCRLAAAGIRKGAPCHVTFGKLYDTRSVAFQDELCPSCQKKVQEGVWIDLFPLCGVSDDDEEAKASIAELDHNWSFIRLATYKLDKASNPIKTLARLLLVLPVRLRGFTYYLRKRDELMKAMPDYRSVKRSIIPSEPWYYLKSEDFMDTDHAVFEGRELPIPSGWDSALTTWWGDWRQLPPEDKRYTKHTFKVYHLEQED
ncbi:MAG: LicD family protein [Coriobacteriales bacterium]|nr:LicD family protein [Coriobacteriales bacterium]